MPRRGDTELVDAVARESAMTRGERLAFGGLLEAEKATGGGTKNARGDFTPTELRERARDAPAAAAIDRALAGRAAGAEQRVGGLTGEAVHRTRLAYDDALTLAFERSALRLPRATWLLRADGDLLVCSGDERAPVLDAFARLEGRRPTEARVRARDAALSLRFEDDPFVPSYELAVRGPRRCRAESWELETADGLLVVAGPGGALHVGPDEAPRVGLDEARHG